MIILYLVGKIIVIAWLITIGIFIFHYIKEHKKDEK